MQIESKINYTYYPGEQFPRILRRRQLSLNMIRRLSAGFGIPADLLIRPIHRSPTQPTGGERVYTY
jgi:hypothetical protein